MISNSLTNCSPELNSPTCSSPGVELAKSTAVRYIYIDMKYSLFIYLGNLGSTYYLVLCKENYLWDRMALERYCNKPASFLTMLVTTQWCSFSGLLKELSFTQDSYFISVFALAFCIFLTHLLSAKLLYMARQHPYKCGYIHIIQMIDFLMDK